MTVEIIHRTICIYVRIIINDKDKQVNSSLIVVAILIDNSSANLTYQTITFLDKALGR